MRLHPPARPTDRVALAVARGLLAGLAGTGATAARPERDPS